MSYRIVGPAYSSDVRYMIKSDRAINLSHPIFSIRMRAVVDTFVRAKFLQLYSRQGIVQAYRAYKNRPSPKLTCLPFLDLVLNLVQITSVHTST
eukprot:SAG11_NODE_404_length_9736_cov_20.243022_16_plen_94_part_00